MTPTLESTVGIWNALEIKDGVVVERDSKSSLEKCFEVQLKLRSQHFNTSDKYLRSLSWTFADSKSLFFFSSLVHSIYININASRWTGQRARLRYFHFQFFNTSRSSSLLLILFLNCWKLDYSFEVNTWLWSQTDEKKLKVDSNLGVNKLLGFIITVKFHT